MRLLLFCLLLLPNLSFAQHYFYTPDCALPTAKKNITIGYTANVLVAGRRIPNHTSEQTPADGALPIMSLRYGFDVEASAQAYQSGDFAKAAALLEEPARQEPDNLYILTHYARALFQQTATKGRSFTVYRQLIAQLDEELQEGPTSATVDASFLEAYWKLGVLRLDNQQWAEADYDITRFLIGLRAADQLNTPIHEQALSYLTECHYMMGHAELCRYFGNKTLQLFPGNTYVRKYLSALSIAKPSMRKS
ncbi:hypothetical protein [Solirubrum puertoriconensis]|nr:hypothetical protein [Solirubrum puertoriconensis]